ncbi:hypothetical protein [Aquimarina sp. RZ0]|uniref:hypothetical protein n=1 Tax=Aquimarina sp. RZ0 TaxID=2607730 RepID=UPI0011F12FF4|nr:hypothetical protein [Aquimarina sp. RZ0]KAA1244984.1 hypothetical protein F0000_14000 [Aquimarina sp. RZ0]
MNDELNIEDLRLIIHNLITFIVVEGKVYVKNNKKHEYVTKYVYLLAKVIHQIDEEEQISIVKEIADDISKYIE